jgi:hypothetical protein
VPAQPAKETVKMALPWQDISTFKHNAHQGAILLKYNEEARNAGYPNYAYLDNGGTTFTYIQYITHWLPITPPEKPTVEAPVEPERVSVQEFAKQLDYGHWVKCSEPKGRYNVKSTQDFNEYFQLYSHLLSTEVTLNLFQQIIAEGNPIYSRTTNPTAWLASQAEKEGNK